MQTSFKEDYICQEGLKGKSRCFVFHFILSQYIWESTSIMGAHMLLHHAERSEGGGEAELQTPDVLLRNDFGSGDDPKLRSSSWCTGQAWEIKEPEQHNGLESLASIEKTRSLLRQAAFLWSCCQNCTWTLNSLKAFISLKSPRINRLSLFFLLYFLVSPAEYTFCPYTSCDTLHS